MLRPVLIGTLLAALAAPVLPLEVRGADDIDSLLSELTKLKDDADPELILKLSKIGDRDAMEALLGVYDSMASIYMRREVVRGLARFDGVAEAEQPALQKIMDVAIQAKDRELREAALDALGTCRNLGKTFLAMVVDSPTKDDVREYAMRLHVERAESHDNEWYRKHYERQEPLAGGKKKKKKGDEEEVEKKIHQLESVRELAFGAIVDGMADDELLTVVDSDSSQTIRMVALTTLQGRNNRETEKIAREIYEKVDASGTMRAHAATILAEIDGPKMVDSFIDLAKKKAVTPDLMRETMADLLAEFRDDGVDSKTSKLVGKGKPHEKLFALRATRLIRDEKLDKKIRRGLKDKDHEVQLYTVFLLGQRRDKESVKEFEKMIDKAKDERLLTAVLKAMSQVHDGANDWVEELIAYSDHEDLDVRNAAIRELGRLGDPKRLELLVGKLANDNWSTRFAALHALEELRSKDAVEAIIERMPEESGRMLHEFADVLFRLTGEPFRTRHANWKAWWANERDSFTAISATELEARAQEEEDRRLKQITNVEFFGIRIISHRVIFIIDVSGSMNESLRGEYVGRPGEVRIEKAKKELSKCIQGLDPKALFNMVTYSSGVSAWLDSGIVGSNSRTRDEALKFVDRLGAGGATNIYGAVRLAFEDPDVDTIYLLSDGEPTAGDYTDPHRIREEVASWNEDRGIEIHCIAVGGSLQLLEWLAEDSGGSYVKFN